MAKDTNIQIAGNLTENFRGYAALLRRIKQRVQIAQQRVIYAANEYNQELTMVKGAVCLD